MLYFLIYLFIEVFVSVKIASLLGPFWTFVEIVGSAIYGLWSLNKTPIRLNSTMQAVLNGDISYEEFEKMHLYSILGAILLIIPGFFTDILGVLLQFGVFSKFIGRRILKLKRREEDSDVIDVEIIER